MLEIRVRSIATGGEGVGDLPDGRVCFIPRSAPGDLVQVELTQDRSRWARGRVVRVVESGPGRVPPPCPFYASCGGCAFQHLRYDEQLAAKGSIARETLRRIGGLDVGEVTVHPSSRTTEYRNRASFSLRRLKGGRVVAGFRELMAPSRVLDLDGPCLLLDPVLSRVWLALRGSWGRGAEALPGGRELRLTLRAVGEGVMLLVQGGVGGPGSPSELLQQVEGLEAIWWEPKDGKRRLLASTSTDIDSSLLAFVQVNPTAGGVLRERVLDLIGNPAGLRIVDAYCGIGVLGRELARRGASVLGIELDPDAVAAARREEVRTDPESPGAFEIHLGRVEEVLPRLPNPDLVLLNPPRSGLDPAVVEHLLRSPPPRLIYVSCDPATLARDSSRLGDTMAVSGVEAVDMFPQTSQMETILAMVRSEMVSR
jgi:23S rRNA (uracil1939-C5)-methyltransferase